MILNVSATVVVEKSNITFESAYFQWIRDYSFNAPGATQFLDYHYPVISVESSSHSCWNHYTSERSRHHYCVQCKNYCSYDQRSYFTEGRVTTSVGSDYPVSGPYYIVADRTYVLTPEGRYGLFHNGFDRYTCAVTYNFDNAEAAIERFAARMISCTANHKVSCPYYGEDQVNHNSLVGTNLHTSSAFSVTTYVRSKISEKPVRHISYNCTDTSQFPIYTDVVFKGCRSEAVTFPTSTYNLTIKSGMYQGSPAVSNVNCTVEKGTFTDNGGTSTFTLGEDSEQTVTTSDGKTITTVKLSNPPVIIDWADFPG